MTIFTCKHCNYFSDRKYNLQKHINNKHAHVLLKNDNVKNVQNDIPKIQNDIPCEFYCKKCNKMYKTARHLKTHESKCNKVDSLTCPKCMISFTHRNNKNRHIKENKCKARSIIHAPDLRTFNILPTMVQSRMQRP